MSGFAGFLAEASPALRTALEELAEEVRLERGAVLFDEGAEGDALYAVLAGRADVSVLSEEGRKLTLDIVHPGAIIGEITLFDPGPRTATVTALEPMRLSRVRHADFLRAIRAAPELAIDMVRLAGRRMRYMNGQLSDQVFLPMPTRLARKLRYLAGQSGEATLALSQAELAEFAGATREAVSRTLNAWKADGVIEVSRRGVRILDAGALDRLAGSDLS